MLIDLYDWLSWLNFDHLSERKLSETLKRSSTSRKDSEVCDGMKDGRKVCSGDEERCAGGLHLVFNT